MLIQHIALVPVADGVDASELGRVAAALQKQVLRDVAQHWGTTTATVAAFPRLEDVPLGYWPILLTSSEQSWGDGVHLDENGQPYAQVTLSPHWSVDASRACLEMLVNPLGERSIAAAAPRADQGTVQFLLEICASCAHVSHAYPIDGVLVADFCTPAFFVRDGAPGQHACSFHGALSAPFQLLSGGHLTWFDIDSNDWWMRVQDGERSEDKRLGPLDRPFLCVRELVSRQRGSAPSALEHQAFAERARSVREPAQSASHARARRLRALVGLAVEVAAPLLLDREASSEREPGDERQHRAPVETILPPQGAVVEAALLPGTAGEEPAYATVQDHELEPAPIASTELTPVAAVPAPEAPVLAVPAPAAAGATSNRPTPAATSNRPALASRKPPPAWRAPFVNKNSAPATNAASSSIAPIVAAVGPPERPRRFRDVKLLAGAAVVGIAFFALVARERGAASANARARTPNARQVAASAAVSSVASVAKQVEVLDAGAATKQVEVATAAAADAGVGPATLGVSSAPKRNARERRPSHRLGASPESAPAAIEDLIDTRR